MRKSNSNKLFRDRIDFFRPYIKNKKVLDLGCVGGDFRLNERIITPLHNEIVKEAREAVGIDLDKKGIEIMRRKNPQLKLVFGDVYRMPFKTSSFDVIVAGELMEHLDNAGLFLKEINRVLKRNGVLLGSVPNAYNLAGFIRILFFSQPTPSRDSTHVHIFDNRTLYLMLLQNDFEAEIYFRNFPHILGIIPYTYPMFSPEILFAAKKIFPSRRNQLLKIFYRSITA